MIATLAKRDIGTMGSFLPDFAVLGGFLCLVGFLISIVFDYLPFPRNKWPNL